MRQQLSPEDQETLLGLGKAHAKDVKKNNVLELKNPRSNLGFTFNEVFPNCFLILIVTFIT
ncbi:hypothetical protein J500_0090 [Acinetobacter sp. 479375]|nr:hypothetical protein J500_0090 [Acinetobacter sp. 479375]RSO79528.1 hypothetical protein EA748_16710 [Acinetobacter ursingii]